MLSTINPETGFAERAGRMFGPTAQTVTQAVGTANTIMYYPIRIKKAGLFTKLYCVKNATQVGNCRIAVYSDNSGQPGQKIVESVSMNTATAGIISDNISQILGAGLYWLAFNTTVSAALTLGVYYEDIGFDPTWGVKIAGMKEAFAFGAFPATATPVANQDQQPGIAVAIGL